ncbi:hypothetical protein CA052_01275 [Salmonella enterica]|nr:hypothetical protein [Salmonella enterica]EBR6994618.1 hypothetical protein [Salmonella enterica]
MYFVDNSTGVSVMPIPDAVFSTNPLWFTRGDSNNQPTYPGPDWMNSIQAEIMNVISAAGIELKKDDNTQLSQAIAAIIASKVIEPPVTSVNGKTGDVTLAAADVHALPDTYSAPVSSVNGKTGAVTLAAADVHALPDTYTPPAAPVSSVNGKTGAVTLAAADVHALPDTYTPPPPDLSAYLTTATANSTYQKINTASKASNGWFQDSNTGMIFQWVQGDTVNNQNDQTVWFPIAFPVACAFAIVSTLNVNNNGDTEQNYQFISKTNTNCVVLPNRADGSTGNVAPLVWVVGY